MGGPTGSCAARRQMAQRRGSRVLALGGALARASRARRARFETRTSPTCMDRVWSYEAERVHSYSRMLKNSASRVLASFRSSTNRTEYVSAQDPPPHNSAARTNVALLIRRTVRLAAALPAERRVLARRGWAGEKSELLTILWKY